MNRETVIALALCCVYPLVIHVLLLNARTILETITRIDWRNVEWNQFNPWRKDND